MDEKIFMSCFFNTTSKKWVDKPEDWKEGYKIALQDVRTMLLLAELDEKVKCSKLN